MSGISSNEKKSKHKGMLNWNLFLIVVILFEFLIFGAANQKFLNISSMFRSMNDFVPIGIIGIFVTLVMITGGIDIQAGSIVGLTSIIIGVAWQDWGMNIWAAVVLAIVIAILCGTLTGFFIAYCGVQAMVATLGGSFLYAGLALMVSTLSDTPSYMGITNFPDAFRNITKFKIGTISPGPVLVFVIIAVIMGIVLHKTKYGRKIFLVGVNQNAGEFSGINTKRVILSMNNDYDFILVNFANPDMVGHTGNMDAATKACMAVDMCLNKIMEKAEDNFYKVVILADHGNADIMINDDGSICTTHTTSVIPFILCDEKVKLQKTGSLVNVAPTILDYMDIAIPKEMEGTESLIVE